MKKLTTITILLILIQSTQYLSAQDWHITGNAGTSASTNFIGTTDNVAFKIRTNGNVRLTVTSGGKVGIGTTSPSSKLDVAGSITGFDSYFNSTEGFHGISVGRSGGSYGSVGYGLTFTGTTNTYQYKVSDFSSMLNFNAGGFDFNTAPSGSTGNIITYTTAMKILQNGNVGIGTSSPGYKLFVTAAPAQATPVAFIENTSGSGFSDGLYIDGFSGSYFIKFLRPDGTMIGRIDQTSSNTVFYTTSSDKRLKNIISITHKGLSDLMKINIYDYTFKSDPAKKIQTGFMAQELYEIFPQSVSKPRENDEPAEKNPWMVDYGSVTPLIIKSVQEQQQMIDELRKINDEKDETIKNLQSAVGSLQKEVVDLKSEIRNPKSEMNDGFAKIQTSNFKSQTLLGQNIPNPFDNSTLIPFRIPKDCNDASIMITNTSTSEVISVIPISCYEDHVSIDAGTLASGTYSYTLYMDGKMIDTKSMELLK